MFCRPTSKFSNLFWPTGKPPPDNPACGFKNERCEWLENGNFFNSLQTIDKTEYNRHHCYVYKNSKKEKNKFTSTGQLRDMTIT